MLTFRYMEKSFSAFTPDVLIYNAGTDVLDGDPLGCLSITPEGIIERDEIVFRYHLSQKLVTSYFIWCIC